MNIFFKDNEEKKNIIPLVNIEPSGFQTSSSNVKRPTP